MKNLLSIITVCKNSDKTLERTIKSVRDERVKITNRDCVEYIIIDGNSTDNTLEIIKRYQNDIDNFTSEDDGGIYQAMNKGWELAKGNYILFLNSDDFIENDSLQSIIDILSYSYKHQFDLITAATNVTSLKHKNVISLSLLRFGLKSISIHNPVPHPSTIVSKELLQRYNGFETIYRIASDYDFFVKVLNDKQNRIVAVSRSFVNMQGGGASDQYKSISNLILIEKELFKIQIKHFGLMRSVFSLKTRLLYHFKNLIARP